MILVLPFIFFLQIYSFLYFYFYFFLFYRFLLFIFFFFFYFFLLHFISIHSLLLKLFLFYFPFFPFLLHFSLFHFLLLVLFYFFLLLFLFIFFFFHFLFLFHFPFFFFLFIFLSLSFDPFPCTCVGLRTSRLLVFVRLESENDRQRRTRLSRVSSRFKTHYSVSHVRGLSFLPRVGVYTSGVYEMTRALSSSFQWTLLLSTFKVPTIHQEWILLSTRFFSFFISICFFLSLPRLLVYLASFLLFFFFFFFFFHLSTHSYLFTWIIKSMQQRLLHYMKSNTFFCWKSNIFI